jgi:magnesium-transporting ATPase (P-type)
MQRTAKHLSPFEQITPAQVAALEPEHVLTTLQTDAQGLSSAEATERLQYVGSNQLNVLPARGSLLRTLALVVRPLLLPLWIAAGIEYSIGRPETALVIAIAAVLNTAVAALQERKRERASAALYDELPSYARVLRDGREQNIPTPMVVPGDILLLRPNDLVPADARLIDAHNLRTVNLVLSDATPIQHKTMDAFSDGDQLAAELPNVVYTSGRIASGHGQAVVFATGLRTTYGQIAALTSQAHEEPSPLMRAVVRLGVVVAALGTLGAVLGFWYATGRLALSTAQGLGIAALFLVAAVPTGVLPGITLALIEGTRRLQHRKAVFRRLSSVETLGATTIICADRTGTLTQNELTVQQLWTPNGIIDVTGVGYEPTGGFRRSNQTLDARTVNVHAGPLLRAAVLTSTARLLPPNTLDPHWHIVGDPAEAAQVVAAAKAGLDVATLRAGIGEVLPASDETALKAVIAEENGSMLVLVQGPLDEVAPRCNSIAADGGVRALGDAERRKLARLQRQAKAEGGRVIAVAQRVSPEPQRREMTLDTLGDLTLLGALLVVDPPRSEVAAAINACHAAGIRTIMLTGDDVVGSLGVAQRCSLPTSQRATVLSGADVHAMDDAMLQQRLREGDLVLARLTPQQKVRVVETLESLGETVLVTGGAASDVPALKAAHIGVAMGASGSPAAGQAADLILLDDNFATIAAAILEGRAVEQRVRRLLALNLATTMVKLVALVAALSLGLPLLLTIGQQLLIDFLAGLLPGLAVGAGRPDPRLMARLPRRRPLPDRKVYWLGYGWFGAIAATLALAAVALYVADDVPTPNERAALFVSSLRPYNEQVVDGIGQLSLTATSLYVAIGVAALLGAALVRRSAAPHDWWPQILLISLVGLSFAILFALIVEPTFHPYIEMLNLPRWGWGAAAAATALTAILEWLRHRVDPIIKPQAARHVRQALNALKAIDQ